MRRKHGRAAFWIGIAVLWVTTFCGGCGPKYEPISLDEGSQRAGENSSSRETKAEETENVILGKEEQENSTTASPVEESEGVSDESAETESMESEEIHETETSLADYDLLHEVDGETLSSDDMFYQQCGMTREEAELGRTSFIEDVMNDSRDAVAARISYPRTVTVASGSYEVQDVVGFLTYYDEIFTDAFKMELDRQAEQELFCNDGMISFGEGPIWFFPSDSGNSMGIGSINALDGCSVR